MGHRTTVFLVLALAISGQAQQTNKTTAVPPAFREMQQVEDHWSTAITKRDQYALELVLAPQYIGISASGDVATQIGRGRVGKEC